MNSGVKASIEEEDNENLEEDEFSVDVHTLCHPGKNIFLKTFGEPTNQNSIKVTKVFKPTSIKASL